MYENQTFEALMRRMLDKVPADVDKREGSIIYDALAPAALEFVELYTELDRTRELSFADTTSGEFLDRKVIEFGVSRKQATKAIRKGLFYNSSNSLMDVPIGSRFSIADLNYNVRERMDVGQYLLESETSGIAGNQHFGSMLPLDYIDQLARVELADVIVPGEEEESDSALRSRFLERVRRPGTSGNMSDYRQWALEVQGIGDVQVQPLWDGPGTVRLFLLSAEKRAPSLELVENVQNYISPANGTGEGKAPIGADVTVSPAVEVPIDVSVNLTLTEGAVLADVQQEIEDELRRFFKQIAFIEPLVRIIRISAILSDNARIVDFSGLEVNEDTVNVPIQAGQVAVLGTVSLDE